MSLQHYQTMYIAQWQYDWHYDAMAKSPWHSDHDSMKLWLSLRRSDDYVDMATAMKIRKGLEVEEDNAKIR